MYAVVDILGQQFKVEKGQHIFSHRLEAKEGSKVHFDNVLLLDNNGKIDEEGYRLLLCIITN